MRSGRIAWVVLAMVAAWFAAATAAAQTEGDHGAGRLIERPYTAVLEMFMEGFEAAGEVPFAGERSDFDGLCSEPVDAVWRFRWSGLDSVFGRSTGPVVVCVQAEWGVDADGAPTMTGMRYTDFGGTFVLPDGSTIDVEMTFAWDGFDEEAGQHTSLVSWTTPEGGTGRYAGASMVGTSHCRWTDPDALVAGVEPELCVLQGLIRFDPLAGVGE